MAIELLYSNFLVGKFLGNSDDRRNMGGLLKARLVVPEKDPGGVTCS